MLDRILTTLKRRKISLNKREVGQAEISPTIEAVLPSCNNASPADGRNGKPQSLQRYRPLLYAAAVLLAALTIIYTRGWIYYVRLSRKVAIAIGETRAAWRHGDRVGVVQGLGLCGGKVRLGIR